MSIQSKNKNMFFRLAILSCVIRASLFTHSAFAEGYRFDSHLLAGSDFAESIDLDQFNEKRNQR